MRALRSRRPCPLPPHCAPCSYSVFTVLSIHIPAKVTGSNPVVVHIEAAIDNADEDEELPLAPWH
jgi:hypothetical protein